MRKKSITIPIFFYELIIVECDDIYVARNKFAKELGEYMNMVESGKHIGAMVVAKDGCPLCYAFFNNGAGSAIIAHEAFHIVKAMYKFLGVTLEDEEITAYIMQYIINQILNFLS